MGKELLKNDLDYIVDVIDNWRERSYYNTDSTPALKSLNERYMRKDVENKKKEYVFIHDILLSRKMYNEYHKYIGYVYSMELEESSKVSIHFNIDEDTTVFEEIDIDDISTLDRLYDYTFDEIEDIFGKDFYNEFMKYVNSSLYRSPIWDLRRGKAFLFKDENSIDDTLLKRRQILSVNTIEDGYIKFYQVDFDAQKKVDVNATIKYDRIITLDSLLKKTLTELKEMYPTNHNAVYDYLMNPGVYDFATDIDCDKTMDRYFTLHRIDPVEYDTSDTTPPTIDIARCNTMSLGNAYNTRSTTEDH